MAYESRLELERGDYVSINKLSHSDLVMIQLSRPAILLTEKDTENLIDMLKEAHKA